MPGAAQADHLEPVHMDSVSDLDNRPCVAGLTLRPLAVVRQPAQVLVRVNEVAP